MKKTAFIPIVTIAGTLAAATPVVALTSCAQEQYKIGVCTDGDLAVPVTADRAKVEKNKGVTFNLIFAPGGVYSVTRITCNDKDIAKNKYSVVDRTITINENVINGDIEVHVKFTQAPVLTTYHRSVAGGLISDGVITADPSKDLEVKYTKTETFTDGVYVDVKVNGNLLVYDTDFTSVYDSATKTYIVSIKANKIIGQIEIILASYYKIESSAIDKSGAAFDDFTFVIDDIDGHCSPIKTCTGKFSFNTEGHKIVGMEVKNAFDQKLAYGYHFIQDTTILKDWHIVFNSDLATSDLKFIFIVDSK